jgi:hypothetical protein
MRKLSLLLVLAGLAGCATPKIDLNANKMKGQQKARVQNANKNLKEQTGTDMELVKPKKRKFGMPTSAEEP